MALLTGYGVPFLLHTKKKEEESFNEASKDWKTRRKVFC